MKKLATTCLLLFAFALTAMAVKWRPAVINTRDGRRIECLTNGGLGTKVVFKLNENAQKQSLKSASIKYVEFLSDEDHINLWLNAPLRYVKKDGSIVRPPLMSKSNWVQLYADPRGSQKTVMFVLTVRNRYGVSYYYGCYRDADDFAVLCTFGLGYSEENAIKVYMSDCPAIVEYVSQKGVKIRNGNDIQKLIDEYNACK